MVSLFVRLLLLLSFDYGIGVLGGGLVDAGLFLVALIFGTLGCLAL